MGDFFLRQERARRNTKRLVLMFALAVILIIAAVNTLVLFTLGTGLPPEEQRSTLYASTLITVAVIGLGSLFKIVSLRQGGRAVAESLGAVPIDPSTSDYRRRRLLNTVEEMAIASGTPMPAVYVLEEEEGINAFAAGYTPNDAAVAVTRGALERLNRDELQGVIAHEFSHILNGDMRLNIRLIGLLAGILAIAAIGRALVQGASRRRGSGRRPGGILLVMMFGLALWLIGTIGLFFGRLIKAAVSRQREYLADASAVQFTRQPKGLLGALLKIAGAPTQARLSEAKSEEVSHMLFADGFSLRGLFATHPPLAARIQALDPTLDPARIREIAANLANRSGSWDEFSALDFADTSALAEPSRFADTVPAEAISERVGRIDGIGLAQARALLARLPLPTREAAHQPERAALLLAAMIIRHSDQQVQPQLKAILSEQLGARPQELSVIEEALSLLHPLQYFAVATIAIGAISRLPPARIEALIKTLDRLIQADEQMTLFEYCLARLIGHSLAERLSPQEAQPFGRASLHARKEAAQTLLSVLAAHGHSSPEAARHAFQVGAAIAFGHEPLVFAAPANWREALDRALPALDDLRPEAKETLLQALSAVVAHDGLLSPAEAELLRTVAALMHLPVPPLLSPAGA